MLSKFLVLALLVVAFFFTSAAVAGPYEDGWAAYQRGDYATALRFFRPLAEKGNADAQFNLGYMYNRGRGVPQDYVQAVSWYRKAAEQGDASAQLNLGFMYANGQGVPQDYVQAHMWVNLAASRETDPERRSAAVKARDSLAAKMTREQIARAQQLARDWKPKGQ